MHGARYSAIARDSLDKLEKKHSSTKRINSARISHVDDNLEASSHKYGATLKTKNHPCIELKVN